ncbi:MAG: hypothetical protein HY287_13180 [Planctomycetes bacterium]|nr:hypothetical protein [Planctomycetota bacterium]MBI3835275.1 hypothetical protein [Planctomycetota bacterium]
MQIHKMLKMPEYYLFLFSAALILSAAPGANAQDTNPLNPPAVEDIPKGYVLIDGDMLFPQSILGNTAAGYQTNFWLNGRIPYEFDANVTPANTGVANPQSAMLTAMGFWQAAVPNVHFVPRNGTDIFFYVHIQNSTGNNSQVGEVGAQVINIASWGSPYIMAHELGHCMGYVHEHQRPDRDSFVSVTQSNVQNGFGNQLTLMTDPLVYGPYDFDSLMHYDGCSFSVCCPAGSTCNCSAACQTITVLPANNAVWQSKIGQRSHISYWDALIMSFAYPPSNWRFQRTSMGNDVFFSGDFVFPFQSFAKGYDETPSGGTLWILEPGTFAVGPVLDKPITIGAPVGTVTLTR